MLDLHNKQDNKREPRNFDERRERKDCGKLDPWCTEGRENGEEADNEHNVDKPRRKNKERDKGDDFCNDGCVKRRENAMCLQYMYQSKSKSLSLDVKLTIMKPFQTPNAMPSKTSKTTRIKIGLHRCSFVEK